MRIKVIGIGGIGNCLLPILLRYLDFGFEGEAHVTLIDGDTYTLENRERQAFAERGKNKAEATAKRLAEIFPGLEIDWVNQYVTEDNVIQLIRKGDVVFLAVDNDATRKLVSDRCSRLSDACVISGGNDLTDGSVDVYSRVGGEDVTLSLANRSSGKHVLEPQDVNPGDAQGCEEAQASTPQLLLTNNMAAALMLSSFYSWLEGKLSYDMIYFDLLTGNCRAVQRT